MLPGRALGRDRLQCGPGRLQELTCLPVIQEEAGPPTAGGGHRLYLGCSASRMGPQTQSEDPEEAPTTRAQRPGHLS